MIFCFEFEYSSLNDNLAFFLDFYAKDSKLTYSLEKDRYITRLYINGDQEELLKFSEDISGKIPHSIFLQNSRVFVSENFGSRGENFKNSLSNITPYLIENYKNGEITTCENGVFSDTAIKFKDEFVNVTESNFDELLNFAFNDFVGGKILKFKDFNGEFEMLNFDELSDKFNIAMPTNLQNLPKIFISNKNEQVALVSYEKPVVELKTTAIYRQNHPNSPCFFDVCAPRDLFIYALCEKLLKIGVNFVALRAKNRFKATVLENGYMLSNSQIYYSREVLNFLNSSEDRNLANFILTMQTSELKDENTLRLFLSEFGDDEIKIYRKNDSFDVLNLAVPNSFEELFDEIGKEEGGDRLIANYGSNFKLPKGAINSPASFFTLLCIAGRIFGFDDDLKSAGIKLLQNAMDFNGAKGPRLDFKMANKSEFNIVKFIRSGMSFRLAGIDDKILSYGYIESLAHFLSDFCDTLKDEFKVSGAILQGSLFECKTLSNLVLKHVGNGLKTKFSKELSLEESL